MNAVNDMKKYLKEAVGFFGDINDRIESIGDNSEDAISDINMGKFFDADEQVDFLGLTQKKNPLMEDLLEEGFNVKFTVINKKSGEAIEDSVSSVTTDYPTSFYNPMTGDIDYGGLTRLASNEKELNALSYTFDAVKRSEETNKPTYIRMTMSGANLESEVYEMGKKDTLFISDELDSKSFMKSVVEGEHTWEGKKITFIVC